VAYAAQLLDFACHPNSRRAAMSVAERNVPERIERLLAGTPPAAALSRGARWTVFVALILAAVLAACATRAAPPAPPPAAQVPPYVFHGVRLAHAVNPDNYYPAVARHENVSGYVVVEVDVDVLGQLVDVRVLEVQPADPRFGFADAALQVAQNNVYGNTSQQAGSMKFKIKFETKK
jgi:TonB family protein